MVLVDPNNITTSATAPTRLVPRSTDGAELLVSASSLVAAPVRALSWRLPLALQNNPEFVAAWLATPPLKLKVHTATPIIPYAKQVEQVLAASRSILGK